MKQSSPDFSLLDFSLLENVVHLMEGNSVTETYTFRPSQVLAFDQSLNNTGYVVLQGPDPVILKAGVLSGKSAFKGHEGNLSKSTSIFLAVQMLLDEWPDAELIHETPPIGGARMMRPESSLLSAASIRHAAILKGREFKTVSAQTAKKFVCGKANADKKTAHAALKKTWGHLEGYDSVTNEHTRDGLMLSLVWLKED